MTVQFPDLTEFNTPYEIDKETVKKVKTEFAFYLSSLDSGRKHIAILKPLGFTSVSVMNNWWPTHYGEERPLTLYWKRCNDGTGKSPVCRRRIWWGMAIAEYEQIRQHLAGSGCGLKIGEPPLKAELFHKFFTLMRLPVVVSPPQKKWLLTHNYRHLETGKLASYWINGWKPGEYCIEKEYEYFKTSQKDWADHGMDGYR